eukprot:g641.t1
MVDFKDTLICGCENGEIVKILGEQIILRRRIHQSQVTTLNTIESQLWSGSTDRYVYILDLENLNVLNCCGDQGSYIRSIFRHEKQIWAIHGKGLRIFTSELLWKQEINEIKVAHDHQVSELSNEVFALRYNLENLDEEKLTLVSEIDSLTSNHKNQIDSIENRHHTETEQLSAEYERALESYKCQIIELSNKNNELQSESESMSSESRKLKIELSESRGTLNSIDQEMEELKKNKLWLETKIESSFEVLEDAQKQLGTMRSDLDTANSHSEQLASELIKTYQQCTELTKHNNHISKTLKQVTNEKQKLEAAKKNLAKELKSKECENHQLQLSNNDLGEKIQELQQCLIENEQVASRHCEELIQEFNSRESSAQKLHDQEMELLEKKIRTLENSLTKSTEELNDKKLKIQILSEDKERIQSQLSRTNSERIHFTKQIGEANIAIQNLKRTEECFKEELQLKEQTINDLSNQLCEINNNINTRAVQITSGVQTVGIEPDLDIKIKEIESCHKAEIQTKNEEIDQLKHLLESYPTASEIEELRSVNETAEYRRNTLENEIHHLQGSLKEAEESKRSLEDVHQSLKAEYEELKESNSALVQKTIRMESFVKHLKTLERDHEINKQEVHKLRTKLELQTKTPYKSQKSIEQNSHYKSIKCELKQAVSDYELAIQELMKMKDELRLKDEALHQQRVDYEKIVSRLNSLQTNSENLQSTLDNFQHNKNLNYQRSKTERWIPPTGCL